MLEAKAPAPPLSKAEYEAAAETLRVDLLNAQFDLAAADFSVLVLLTGDDRQGVEEVIDLMHEWLDARGLDTSIFERPHCEEREQPPMARLWRALPARGRIGLYSGMWFLGAVAERIDGSIDRDEADRRAEHLVRFERALADDGTLVLKYWLHLPEAERRRRLEEARERPKSHWGVEPVDRAVARKFERIRPVVERFLTRTDHAAARWRFVDGSDPRARNLAFMRDLLRSLTGRLAAKAGPTTGAAPDSTEPAAPGALDGVDLSARLPDGEYDRLLDKHQARLHRLSQRARRREVASVLVFEGWDAAGKGGAIRRLTRAIDAALYRVVPIAAPTDEELAHHYLWRFWRQIPRDGRMAIFDRSWYGRVLVERVEGLASESAWRRAYDEINEFEARLVGHGIVLRKFWLEVSPEEQRRRFEQRGRTPYKKYKYTAEDTRNRGRWADYAAAAEEMIGRTDTPGAPWHVIAAEDKPYARIAVLREVNRALRHGTRRRRARAED